MINSNISKCLFKMITISQQNDHTNLINYLELSNWFREKERGTFHEGPCFANALSSL